MIKNFLNPKGHQNPISGSKVAAILLKGWILPIGGASSGEDLRLQLAKQACCRTAPATPGLLNTARLSKVLIENEKQSGSSHFNVGNKLCYPKEIPELKLLKLSIV